MLEEIDHTVGVKDGRPNVSNEVLGHLVLGAAEETSKRSGLGCRLHCGLDVVVVVRALLGDADSQVNDGDIGGGDTEGHTGKFAIKFWDNFADNLGGANGGWDDVLGSATSTSPVLVRRAVNGLLGGGHSVHGALGKNNNNTAVLTSHTQTQEIQRQEDKRWMYLLFIIL